jgi:hypothetical protein
MSLQTDVCLTLSVSHPQLADLGSVGQGSTTGYRPPDLLHHMLGPHHRHHGYLPQLHRM